jgi:hypothetical protein
MMRKKVWRHDEEANTSTTGGRKEIRCQMELATPDELFGEDTGGGTANEGEETTSTTGERNGLLDALNEWAAVSRREATSQTTRIHRSTQSTQENPRKPKKTQGRLGHHPEASTEDTRATIVKAIMDAIQDTVDDGSRDTGEQEYSDLKMSREYRPCFELARRLRGIEDRHGVTFSLTRQREVALCWLEEHPENTWEDEPEDFVLQLQDGYRRVRIPFSEENVLTATWEEAGRTLPPPATLEYGESTQRLASWCRELQRCSGDKPFHLATRSVQERLKLSTPKAAWIRLHSLVVIGLLAEVDKGTMAGRLATTWRYLGTEASVRVG